MADTRNRKRCGHCYQNLLLPVYKRHRDRYYDIDTRTWSTIDDGIISSDEGSDMSAEEPQLASDDDSSCSAGADDICADLSSESTGTTHHMFIL